MPQKIFISYRRQDSGANAIGIGQYLENEFGRKSVYIDVDMQAGTKFPAVIERRLAECKVMLVLIGPDWLGSKDEHGNLRLQKSDDWVRLEIAYALKRDITVIPVLINGAQLPDRETLPDDIRGLLDHQAASISLAGFRHEMAGLARDIRSIKTAKPWRLFGTLAAALILALIAAFIVYSFGLWGWLERAESRVSSPKIVAGSQNGVWKSHLGEWVLFAIDKKPVAYFISPNSIKAFGDRVAYTARFPLYAATNSSERNPGQGAYEDDTGVLDCKKSAFVMSERTVYNAAGEVIFHFKFVEPESVDFSNSQQISSGTILTFAESMLCDPKLRTLLSKAHLDDNVQLSYLANAVDGDGNIFYGRIRTTSNPTYPFEVFFVDKKNNDHAFADIFTGQNIRGLPSSYRSIAEDVQMSCADRTVLAPALEYYDRDGNLAYLAAQNPAQPMAAKEGSIFGQLLNVACGPSAFNVAGKYEGTNNANYEKGGESEQRMLLTIQQNGNDLKVNFETPLGGQGEGVGKLAGSRVESMSLHSTAPDCPGSYDGSLAFTDSSVTWSYKGEDCGGPMQGHGTAARISR